MTISGFLKEIGRGRDGARSLGREQACELMHRLLAGEVTDLEVGAFCIAMRMKGETPEELTGFLDAVHRNLHPIPSGDQPLVVLPSYNGARKLPLLTPLLGLLLAQTGLPVLIHGLSTEKTRVDSASVLQALGIKPLNEPVVIPSGTLAYAPTRLLSPALDRLLRVREVIGLRNPAHSLVKQMNPSAGSALIVSSHTHPEYAVSMAGVFGLRESSGMLLRGTEGEPVADPRRNPAIRLFHRGRVVKVLDAQTGSLRQMPALPDTTDASDAARYTLDVINGRKPVPEPIAMQVDLIRQLHRLMKHPEVPSS